MEINSNSMIELISLYEKYSFQEPNLSKFKRSKYGEPFFLSNALNKGSYISSDDVIIINGYIIPYWIDFSSTETNIKILFIDCTFQDGLSVKLPSYDNSLNKVGFFNCKFNGQTDIEAESIGIFNCHLTGEFDSLEIKSKITAINSSYMHKGNILIEGNYVKLVDSNISLNNLKIISTEVLLDNEKSGYIIAANTCQIISDNILTSSNTKIVNSVPKIKKLVNF